MPVPIKAALGLRLNFKALLQDSAKTANPERPSGPSYPGKIRPYNNNKSVDVELSLYGALLVYYAPHGRHDTIRHLPLLPEPGFREKGSFPPLYYCSRSFR